MSRPRLLRTDTVSPACARIRANAFTRSSDGRSNSMPAASFSGIRFTLQRILPSSRTRRRASSGVSLTPLEEHVLERDAVSAPGRKLAGGGEDVLETVLAIDGNERIALVFRRRMQGDGEVRHERLGSQPIERRQHSDSRQGHALRRHGEAVLVVEHPQGLHRVVVVVQRFAHAHEHDVELRVAQAELALPAREPVRRSRRRSGFGPGPSCLSGRSRTSSRSPTCVEIQNVWLGVSGMNTDSMRRLSSRPSRNFTVPSDEVSRAMTAGLEMRKCSARSARSGRDKSVIFSKSVDPLGVDPREDLTRMKTRVSARFEPGLELCEIHRSQIGTAVCR